MERNGERAGTDEAEAPPDVAARSFDWRFLLDPVILLCVVALAAFPFLARAAAARQPSVPAAAATVAPPATAIGPTLRDLPVFSADGATSDAVAGGEALADLAAMRRAIEDAMEPLFDPRGRRILTRFLTKIAPSPFLGGPSPSYPFTFPDVDPILDDALRAPTEARVRAASDLGGLLVLAAARFDELARGASLAFAILHRTRAGGGCIAQLNLAFLVATNDPPLPEAEAELREAAQRCPQDPTPLWALGQLESMLMTADALLSPGAPPPAEAVRPAFATFRELQARFPRSSAGWAGEADHELRLAYLYGAEGRRPFSVRNRFRRALALYRRARGDDPDPALAAGEARAFAGLGLYGLAAGAQRRALAEASAPAPLEAMLVEYLERGRRFSAAAATAARLDASARFPRGPALVMAVRAFEPDPADALHLLSLGSRHTLGVTLEIVPKSPSFRGPPGVADLSFIPVYRDLDYVTGHDRWCPGWAARRDLVLAGHPERALAEMPSTYSAIGPGAEVYCVDEFGAALLAAVAESEARHAEAASARVRAADVDLEGRTPRVFLFDARQNLWRFGGDLARAGTVAEVWMRENPRDALAHERAGEIAFLAGDYPRAARLFSSAARMARAAAGTWSEGEASALLKQGTAFEFSGRFGAALDSLALSDEVASRLHGLEVKRDPEGEALERLAYISYNARLQSGDTLLRAHRYAEALEHYLSAREREWDLARIEPGEPMRRAEVIDNNQAIVEIQVGRPADAVTSAERALGADRESPVFLETLAFALRRLGRLEEAERALRAALRSDPRRPSLWNDLGVTYAGLGRVDDAARAFRRSVGVEPDFALGWFNLGVALERMGLRHGFAAQGAFGRAFRADPDLRGSAREFVADERVYFSTLDLSKPLPPKWELATTESRSPVAAAGIVLALLLGLRLGRGFLAQGAASSARQWLEIGRDFAARLPQALASTAGLVAVATTVVVFVIPLLLAGDATVTSVLLLAAGVSILIAVVMRARVLAARRAGVALRQSGWPPAMAVGVGLSVTGLTWAPLPVAETDRPAPAVHWIGPLATGVVAFVLLVLGEALGVPLTTALGVAGLVMTVSLLTPLEPIDGAFVPKGPAVVLAVVALLGLAVFFLTTLS